jgi:Ala-tRNA(Pro) deacylase
MSIAHTVQTFLQANKISYEVLPHRRTRASRETAHTLHVPAERMAKAVILGDRQGYLMAVLPSSRHVDVQELSQTLGRDLAVVPEYRLGVLFEDCAFGAVPPLGFAYGMPTVVDDCLVDQPEIYFEAGDHEDVIRIDGEQFREILSKAEHAQFCL